MTTQINGVEITEKMADVIERWYSCSISWDDTVPFYYVKSLQQIQDFFCNLLKNSEDKVEISNLITIIINIKDDFNKLIPDKNEQ